MVRLEWQEEHELLAGRSLMWIHENAAPGNAHPVATAIAQLRAERVHQLRVLS